MFLSPLCYLNCLLTYSILVIFIIFSTLYGTYAKIYQPCELARELKNFDFPDDEISTWVCIAQHESNFDTAARNPGSGDHGLFQISEIYWCSPPGYACNTACIHFRDDDITDDVQCIRRIFNEHQRLSGNGFNAWVVYPLYCKNDTSLYTAYCDLPVYNITDNEITEKPTEEGDGYEFPPLPSFSGNKNNINLPGSTEISRKPKENDTPVIFSRYSINDFIPVQPTKENNDITYTFPTFPASKHSIHEYTAVKTSKEMKYLSFPLSGFSIHDFKTVQTPKEIVFPASKFSIHEYTAVKTPKEIPIVFPSTRYSIHDYVSVTDYGKGKVIIQNDVDKLEKIPYENIEPSNQNVNKKVEYLTTAIIYPTTEEPITAKTSLKNTIKKSHSEHTTKQGVTGQETPSKTTPVTKFEETKEIKQLYAKLLSFPNKTVTESPLTETSNKPTSASYFSSKIVKSASTEKEKSSSLIITTPRMPQIIKSKIGGHTSNNDKSSVFSSKQKSPITSSQFSKTNQNYSEKSEITYLKTDFKKDNAQLPTETKTHKQINAYQSFTTKLPISFATTTKKILESNFSNKKIKPNPLQTKMNSHIMTFPTKKTFTTEPLSKLSLFTDKSSKTHHFHTTTTPKTITEISSKSSKIVNTFSLLTSKSPLVNTTTMKFFSNSNEFQTISPPTSANNETFSENKKFSKQVTFAPGTFWNLQTLPPILPRPSRPPPGQRPTRLPPPWLTTIRPNLDSNRPFLPGQRPDLPLPGPFPGLPSEIPAPGFLVRPSYETNLTTVRPDIDPSRPFSVSRPDLSSSSFFAEQKPVIPGSASFTNVNTSLPLPGPNPARPGGFPSPPWASTLKPNVDQKPTRRKPPFLRPPYLQGLNEMENNNKGTEGTVLSSTEGIHRPNRKPVRRRPIKFKDDDRYGKETGNLDELDTEMDNLSSSLVNKRRDLEKKSVEIKLNDNYMMYRTKFGYSLVFTKKN